MALDGEGLRFVDPTSGVPRPLPFDTPADKALAALEPALGRPAERSANTECGAGPLEFATWPNGFSAVLFEGRFVGWSLREDVSARLTTTSGVGVGSTRGELESAYEAKVEQTTLGTEFSAGGLSGLLSSVDAEARITTLWAGVSCVFR